MTWALFAAVFASVGYGVATLLQAVAARRATGLAVILTPLAVAGLVLEGVAGVVSLVALARLPLFVVQGIVAASLVVVVLAAPRVLRVPLRVADAWVAGGVVAALVVVTVAAGDEPARRAPGGFSSAMLAAVVALALGLLATYRRGPAWLVAGLSGLGYSGAAVAARAVEAGPLWQPVLLVALAVSAAVGIAGYLRALESGRVGAVAAVVAVVEVVVPGVVGVLVLGDGVRAGWAPAAFVAIAAAVVGCVALANSPTTAAAEVTPG
ncbi:MAG: hypothetical protein FWF90_03710 [Promicromonosporaceae bacterium]|nr:hypothetical protein [Promicromonosporaceae bacterium]